MSTYPSRSSNNKEEVKLAIWLDKQRANFKKGLLSLDKIKKLESLPGWKWEGDLNEGTK